VQFTDLQREFDATKCNGTSVCGFSSFDPVFLSQQMA
jgi:hypothetical protein